MNIPPKIREYYMLCATKLGSKKLPAENMEMIPRRQFELFLNIENNETVARETVIGGGGSNKIIVV